MEQKQDAEIDILYSPPAEDMDGLCPSRLNAFSPTYRLIVEDRSFAGADLPWRRPTLRISAEARDLDPVAEALAFYLTGPLLICADWMDLFLLAGVGQNRTGHGRALVCDGVGDPAMAGKLGRQLQSLAGEGFSGGLLFVQMLTPATAAALDALVSFDAFLTAVVSLRPDTDAVGTCVLEASRDAVVAVAFEAGKPLGKCPIVID